MFDVLKTGIDGLDAILGGGIRYPAGGAAFVFLTGGAGSGKTVLALELAARAWLEVDDGSTCLYYSVEHTPRSLYRKLAHDFAFYGTDAEVERLPQEVPHKLVLEARRDGRRSRLVITQANPAALESAQTGSSIDIEWILAEIANHGIAGRVKVACVDNIGLLLTDLDYYQKRRTLLATRRQLMDSGVHGIFVQETASPGDLRMPSAEEFSTDLLIELSFQTEYTQFKARTIEIAKARHQVPTTAASTTSRSPVAASGATPISVRAASAARASTSTHPSPHSSRSPATHTPASCRRAGAS